MERPGEGVQLVQRLSTYSLSKLRPGSWYLPALVCDLSVPTNSIDSTVNSVVCLSLLTLVA